MIYAILIVLGLCFGSFINALVWRLHEQEEISVKAKKANMANELSIVKGRSMCPHCRHELAAKDLLPVLSWLSLRGKCRYCGAPISAQYPVVELATSGLFLLSYRFWPESLHGWQVGEFALWLVVLIGLIALLVYDLHWMLLPNRIVLPLMVVAVIWLVLATVTSGSPWHTLAMYVLAIAIGGGIFYGLFHISNGKWIGGGDVNLGFLLGMLVGTAEKSLLIIFLAALLGSLISLPLLMVKKLNRSSLIPFGPFLIIAGIVAVLFGDTIVHWYNHTILLVG